MLGSKRNPRASLGYVAVMACLALILASCTTFHWITPVPTLDTPSAPAADEPQPGTPEPAAVTPAVAATPEAVAEAEEEEGEEGEGEGDDQEGVEEASAKGEPRAITHALSRREVCSDCHAVETGKQPAPADHINLTDDLCLYCHMPEEGEAAVPPLPDPATTEFCLTCHGPFEELMARTAGYVVDDEEINPHMYVPHDRTNIQACKNCHKPHQLPVLAPEEIPTASIQYCYAACHHEQNFEPCSDCH